LPNLALRELAPHEPSHRDKICSLGRVGIVGDASVFHAFVDLCGSSWIFAIFVDLRVLRGSSCSTSRIWSALECRPCRHR
jgi:hypothetical protein